MNSKLYLALMFGAWLLRTPIIFADDLTTNAHSIHQIHRHPAIDELISTATATNGLTIGVDILEYGIGTNITELPVGLIFKAPTNTQSAFYLPQEEYLAQIELYDTNNLPVEKTKPGSEYGRAFNELTWDINKFATPLNGGHPKIIIVDDNWDSRSWGCKLPKVSDLFVLTKPGKYRLKLQVQVMLLYLNTKEKQTRQIVCFPPVEMTVERPKESDIRK